MANALVIVPLKVAKFFDFIMSEMSRNLFTALSLDLDMGGPPELKSDEKLKCIIQSIEISSCEDLFTAEKVCYTFSKLYPAAGHVGGAA